jgi:predicted MFS family arabinose efflux permease
VTTLANITSSTISTSSTTGALTVAGGLGVAGNIYGGALYDNGTAVLTINSTVDGGTY